MAIYKGNRTVTSDELAAIVGIVTLKESVRSKVGALIPKMKTGA